MAVVFLFGCAQKVHEPIPQFSAANIDAGMYMPKINNFLVIFDGSISMGDKVKEEKKLDLAKAIVDRMNKTIPEMGQSAGLRSFGHAPEVSKDYTHLWYGMTEYSTLGLDQAFNIAAAGGLSKLELAFDGAQEDFEGNSRGQNAVVIISDGLDLSPVVYESAQALKDKFGSAICFYTIHVGEAPEGKEVLQKIANIGGCGTYTHYKGLLTGPGMGMFVKENFLAEKPAPPPVVKQDSDNDGVLDEDDQCPNTPAGASVNSVGCWAFSNMALFDFDKAVIKPEAYPMLDEAGIILKKNPSLDVILQGHTDNIGNDNYNMGLSLRRAKAIKAYLVNKGIDGARIETQGFGASKPMTSNDTEEGRAQNRRVEIKPN